MCRKGLRPRHFFLFNDVLVGFAHAGLSLAAAAKLLQQPQCPHLPCTLLELPHYTSFISHALFWNCHSCATFIYDLQPASLRRGRVEGSLHSVCATPAVCRYMVHCCPKASTQISTLSPSVMSPSRTSPMILLHRMDFRCGPPAVGSAAHGNISIAHAFCLLALPGAFRILLPLVRPSLIHRLPSHIHLESP